MFRLTFTILSLVFACQSFGSSPIVSDAPSDFIVKAKRGDGVFSLLRRFQITNNTCNRERFYELNNMKESDALHIDRDYKLPVKIYDYNGRSIRSTLNIKDWDQAVAIKEYNDALATLKVLDESYIQSKKLWVPYDLIACFRKTETSATAAPGKKKEDAAYVLEPIFGKTHEQVLIKDHTLKNKVYYLVSGHGGPDPGAQCLTCPTVMCEDEYAYDVTLRLARYLMERSATVHIIIQDPNDGIREDKYLKCDRTELSMGKYPMPVKQLRRLEQRSKNINQLHKKYKAKGITEQYAIMVHIDSRAEQKRQDVFFYYYKDGTKGQKLAHQMQKTFKSKYEQHQKGRGYAGFVRSRNLYMVRTTHPTAILVELGNIRNKADQKRFLLPQNRQALATWLGDGLATFKP